MLLHKPILTVVLVLIGTLQIKSSNLEITKSPTFNANDYIIGELTPDSVLAHTGRATSYNAATFDFHGLFKITRIEALDQKDGRSGFVSSITGGIGEFFVRVWLSAYYEEQVDYIINIYGEPLKSLPSNDLVIGEETPYSQLVHTEQINSIYATESFTWDGPNHIVKIEAIDQSQGFGGVVSGVYGGVGNSFVAVDMVHFYFGAQIDFIINIYAEDLNSQDYIIGELTPNSVLAHTGRATGYNAATFDFHGLFNITKIEALDQKNGRSGFVSRITGGINEFFVRVWLNVYYEEQVDFIINIYGEPLESVPSNDFVIGEETSNSQLVHTEKINSIYATESFTWDGTQTIVRVEVLDQSQGFGGIVSDVYGGVDNSFVVVHMEHFYYGAQIDFIINIYAEN